MEDSDISTSLEDWFNMATEHQEQSLVIQWAETKKREYPELSCLFAIPNFSLKHISFAAKMKREGLRAGVPDLCLPVARGGYNALFIEMKRLVPRRTKTMGLRLDKTKTTDNQNEWHEKLRITGNLVLVCYTADEAEAVLEDYLRSRYVRAA